MFQKIRALALVVVAGISLAGCAALQQKLQAAQAVYAMVADATVTPQKVLIVANSFDALQGTGTQYLNYCVGHLSAAICSADNRRAVIKYTRAGRAARNQLETYMDQSTDAPSAPYNTLASAVNSLNLTPANGFVAPAN